MTTNPPSPNITYHKGDPETSEDPGTAYVFVDGQRVDIMIVSFTIKGIRHYELIVKGYPITGINSQAKAKDVIFGIVMSWAIEKLEAAANK